MTLTSAIFLAMAAGTALGLVAPGFALQLSPLTAIFLRLVQSIIAPLILGGLITGIATAGSGKAIGRIGLKSLVYFQIVTVVVLLLALAAGNLFRPGDGLHMRGAAAGVETPQITWQAMLEQSVPASVFDAMAQGQMLQLVVFAALFGMACVGVGERAQPVVRFFAAVNDLMFRYTHYVMYVAPLGIGAAMATTIARGGWSVFSNFGRLIAAEYSALAALLLLFYLPLMLAARIPVLPFLAAIREPFAIAFATTASGAALPVALEKMEAFGVPRPVLNLVMPLGFCFNTAGSSLHILLSCLFLAQAVDFHFDAANQWAMFAVLLVMTKGVAALPRTTLVVIIGILNAWGVPLDALPVLLGVDAVLDMFRTSVNLIGNCLAPALIARIEGVSFVPALSPTPETPAQTR